MSNLFRDQKWIVTPLEAAQFPNRCVKSNDQVQSPDHEVTVDLLPVQVIVPKSGGDRATEVLSTILVGRGITQLAQLAKKKRITFHIGLNEENRLKTRKRKKLSIIFFIVSVLMPIVSGTISEIFSFPMNSLASNIAMGIGMAFFMLFLISGIVMFAISSMGVVNTVRSDGYFVWLSGGCDDFLDSLPESPVSWDGMQFQYSDAK